MSTSAFILNIIWFGHHTRRSCQLLFPHGTFGKIQHGNLQVPLDINGHNTSGETSHGLRCMHRQGRKGRFVL